MTSAKPFVLGSLLGAGLVFFALQYHVIQSRDGFRLVPRAPQHSLGTAYVDARRMESADWADRPLLMQAVVAHGSTDLVTSSVADDMMDSMSSVLDSEGSSLDQVRDLLNGSSQSDGFDQLFDSSESLQIPSFEEMTPEGFGTQDGSRVPFPSEAQNRKDSIETALRDSETARDDRRPSLDDVFSAGSARAENLKMESTSRRTALDDSPSPSPVNSSGSNTRTEETPIDDSPYQRSRPSTDSVNQEDLFGEVTEDESALPFSRGRTSSPKDNESNIMGMFEDVTSSLGTEAASGLDEVRSKAREELSSRLNESAASADRFVRESVKNSLPDSVTEMFSDGSPAAAPFQRDTSGAAASEESLPAALRAIRDGFDPFLD